MILAHEAPDLPGLARGSAGQRDRMDETVRRQARAWVPRDSRAATWAALAAFGRQDLVLGRLLEGHVDALAILAEAGRKPVAGALYGVWASRSEGTGLRAERYGPDWHLTGLLRYCTGVRLVDRALVTGITPGGETVLLDLAVGEHGWRAVDGTWPAVGMDLSESLDVEVDVVAEEADFVGAAGFYLQRPGFTVGGVGVAAVWLGGAAGVLDTVLDGLRRFEPNPHQLVHLGAMSVSVSSADAVLERAANHEVSSTTALACRAAVDAAVETVLVRAPRLTGATPLCRDGDFAHRLADLQVYVRQQHAERDLAELGTRIVQGKALDA